MAASRSKSSAIRTATTTTCGSPPTRSEEHTSELQSQSNLVCRLLLEKKNKITAPPIIIIIVSIRASRVVLATETHAVRLLGVLTGIAITPGRVLKDVIHVSVNRRQLT